MNKNVRAWMISLAAFAALAGLAPAAEPKFALIKEGGVYIAEGPAAEPKLAYDYKSEFAAPHFLGFSPDGKSFVVAAQSAKAQKEVQADPEANAEMMDAEIHLQSTDGKRERIPATGDCFCEAAVFSPDGKRIALWYADLLNGYAAIELWSPGQKSVKKIEPPEGWSWPLNGMEVLAWSADSKSLWYCEEKQDDAAWKGRFMRFDVKDGKSARHADAPTGLPCLSSLMARDKGPIALAAKQNERAGLIAYAEPQEGKGPAIKTLAEPAVEELLPLPGGKAIAIHWEAAKAYLYDPASQKAEPLAKFDLKGKSRSWLSHALEIGGAPAVAFRAASEESTTDINLLLDLKTGEWKEIFKGYRLDRVWAGE